MKRMHFIGICGTAMGTLAAMLKARGYDVQGSDHAVYPPMSDFLAGQGIRILDGYDPNHITADIDTVVVGNAVSRGNVELEEVLDRKIHYVSLPEAIREHFLWQSRSIVVAGTHGKTSTTSLTGWLLTAGGRDPSVLVGGIVTNFGGSYRLGSGRDFVIEGDEYDSAFFDKTAKFLKYLPDIAIVGNLEYDHADIYPDMESLRIAFRRFITLVPRNGLVILGADSPEAMKLASVARAPIETVGLSGGADWMASNIHPSHDMTAFDVTYKGDRLGQFHLPLHGEHNVRNALAAMAAGHAAGLSPDTMRHGLTEFQGIRRRLELRGTARNVAVYDDFAHHPTAILETLRAIRASYPDRRLWAIFEPRSATSCRRVFQDDFARAFAESGADEIILAAVFRASLPEAERLSIDVLIHDLTTAGHHARSIPHVDDIVSTVAAEAGDGDLVVIMSNGGFDGIHEKLLRQLRGGEFERAARAIVGASRVRRDVPIAPLTTFKVGGLADYFVEARSEEEIVAIAAAARMHSVPLTILGGGSNVLVSDAGVDGVVLRACVATVTSPRDGVVRSGAGTTINGLVRWTIGRGLAGLEAWAGTPGTVGGAIYGNAHYGGRNIGDLVTAVGLLKREGEILAVSREEMQFSYDHSRLQETGEIVLWAEFAVTSGDAAELRSIARASLAHRKRTQPLASHSAGCIFQNPNPTVDVIPPGIPASAGALIDRAGLKGRRIGGATISPLHGNFFVNEDHATAADIRALIDTAKAAVRNEFGVVLREEIVYLGK